MLIHSEIQRLCFGGGISRLLFAFYGMSSSRGVHIHIKANNLHHADYSLVDLTVINCFLIHDTIFVKKKTYITATFCHFSEKLREIFVQILVCTKFVL